MSTRSGRFFEQGCALLYGRLISSIFGRGDQLAASVIIVTRDRSTYLDFTLYALAHQSLPKETWEVLVIDCASRDATPELLDRYIRRGEMQLSVKVSSPKEWISALNSAVMEARGRILILVGDNRVTATDFVMRHVARHLRGDRLLIGESNKFLHTHLLPLSEPRLQGVAVQGVISPEQLWTQQTQSGLAFTFGSDYTSLFKYWRDSGSHRHPAWLLFRFENSSLPRHLVLRLGGFDENIPYGDETTRNLVAIEIAFRCLQHDVLCGYYGGTGALCQLSQPLPLTRTMHQAQLCYLLNKHIEWRDPLYQQLLALPA